MSTYEKLCLNIFLKAASEAITEQDRDMYLDEAINLLNYVHINYGDDLWKKQKD